MSKYKMTCNDVGGYEYRGYTIDRISCYDNESKFSHWNILGRSGCLVEAANTLKECRYWIDRMCNNQGEA